MSFSPRATQLMRELDQLQSDLETNIASLASEIEKGRKGDKGMFREITFRIGRIALGYPAFVTRILQEADSPVEPETAFHGPATTTWLNLKLRANAMRCTFSYWLKLQSRVDQFKTFKRKKLYPPRAAEGTAEARHERASDQAFNQVHAFINPHKQSEDGLENMAFADIPLPQSTFIRHMHAAYRITLAQTLGRPARFLDVGCGGGLKVMTAAQWFRPSEGIDLDPNYVDVARNLLATTCHESTTALQANALTFDGYGDYDVIYFYRPIEDRDLLNKLEERIIASARPDALLIAPYNFFDERYEELGCASIENRIYLAQGSKTAATALRRKAMTFGVDAPRFEQQRATIWSPIEEALSAQGFSKGAWDESPVGKAKGI